MAIEANRKAQIDQKVQQAVQQRIARNNNVNSQDDVKKEMGSSVSIFLDGNMSAEEKNYAYDAYSSQILKNYYDENGDGSVSVEEFGKKETADLYSSKENDVDEVAKRKGYLLAENMDIDGDGKISIDEFSYFTKKSDSIDKKLDGKFNSEDEGLVATGFLGINANSDDVRNYTNKYLEGRNFDDSAKDYLDATSQIIRSNVADDAKNTFNMTFDTPALKKGLYLGDIAPKIPGADEVKVTFTETPAENKETEEGEKAKETGNKTDKEEVNVSYKDNSSYTMQGLYTPNYAYNRNNYNYNYNPYMMPNFGGGGFVQPQQNKWQQAGNLFGSLLSGFAMFKSIFGGGFGPRFLSW